MDDASILRALPDPVVIIDREGTLVWANDTGEETFGWRREDWLGRVVIDLVHPDDQPSVLEALVTVHDKQIGTLVEVRVRASEGAWRLVEVHGRPFRSEEIDGILLVARDITERRRWELASGESAVVQALVQHASVIFFLVGADGTVCSASAALTRTLDHWLEATIGRPFLDLVADEDRRNVAYGLDSPAHGISTSTIEAHLLRRDGTPVLHQLTLTDLLGDAVVRGVLITAHDISELERSRRRLHHLATHDHLTGLPNRPALMEALTRRLVTENEVAVIFVDLDAFKAVNDRLGHVAGDRVLQIVADRLAAAAPPAVVGRLGGDEFLAIVDGDDAAIRAARLAEVLTSALETPIVLHGEEIVPVRATCGVARSRPGDTAEDLIAAADAAMYHAKSNADRH